MSKLSFLYPVVVKIGSNKVKFYCPFLKEVRGEYPTIEEAEEKLTIMVKIAVEGRYKYMPQSLTIISQEDISKIKCEDDEKIILVTATPKLKFVKKTITIPYELSNCIKEKNINLSQFVQKALYKECSKKFNN